MEGDFFAIIEISGRQELVSLGDHLEVNRAPHEKGKTFDADKVLLVVDGKKIELGKPHVKKKVKFKVIEHKKGKKIDVIKFKAKSRYRRKTGHRQPLSVLEVIQIGTKKVPEKKK